MALVGPSLPGSCLLPQERAVHVFHSRPRQAQMRLRVWHQRCQGVTWLEVLWQYTTEQRLTWHDITRHVLTNTAPQHMTWHDKTWQCITGHDLMLWQDPTGQRLTWHDITRHVLTKHYTTTPDVRRHDMTRRDMTWAFVTTHYRTMVDVTWRQKTCYEQTPHDNTWRDTTWHDKARHDMTWHDMTWHFEIWPHITWHGMTCHGTDRAWRDMTSHDRIHSVQPAQTQSAGRPAASQRPSPRSQRLEAAKRQLIDEEKEREPFKLGIHARTKAAPNSGATHTRESDSRTTWTSLPRTWPQSIQLSFEASMMFPLIFSMSSTLYFLNDVPAHLIYVNHPLLLSRRKLTPQRRHTSDWKLPRRDD